MAPDKKADTELVPRTGLAAFGDIQGVAERPASIDPLDRSGKEEITADEIRLPRLTIAQGLHPQLVPGDGQHIPGLVIGNMFNDVTEEIYGNGPLTVVPIYRHVARLEFDKNDKKVVLARDIPAGDDRFKWSKGTGPNGEDEPPRATEFVEFVSLLLRPGKEPERVVVSIKTTNKEMRAAAKLWTTYIDTRNGPIYSGLYRLTSTIIRGTNKKGQQTMYGVFVVKNAGYIPKDTPAGAGLYEYAKLFHEASVGKTVVVEREAADVNDDFDTEKMDREASMSDR
jgi:hypothetical protein